MKNRSSDKILLYSLSLRRNPTDLNCAELEMAVTVPELLSESGDPFRHHQLCSPEALPSR